MPDIAKSAEKPPTEPTPIKIKIEPKPAAEAKPARGRPKAPPKLTWSDFERDALCKMVDEFFVKTLNSTILRDRSKKLENSKLGSALIYTIYHYTKLRPDHPLTVLMITGLQTGASVMDCMSSPKLSMVK